MPLAGNCGEVTWRERAIKGQVVRIISNRYTVRAEGKDYICTPRGLLRLQDDIFAGDMVEFSKIGEKRGIITKVLPRKNYLIRPNVANLDKAFIVIAPEPAPDLLLVDKMLIHCFAQGIEPILCYNKIDIADNIELAQIEHDYLDIAQLIVTSAITGKGLEGLAAQIKGGLSCFLGQSATGKSSLLNALLDQEVAKTGELSQRIKRGKNTTRHIEIYAVKEGLVADTCGFSMLSCLEMHPEELRLFYDEYLASAAKCKYPSCTHSIEPDCQVIKQVQKGLLPKGRYQRYLTILEELKEKERKKYG